MSDGLWAVKQTMELSMSAFTHSTRDINTPDNHLNPENMMTITIIKRYIFKKWNNYKQVIHYHLYHVISFSQYIIV